MSFKLTYSQWVCACARKDIFYLGKGGESDWICENAFDRIFISFERRREYAQSRIDTDTDDDNDDDDGIDDSGRQRPSHILLFMIFVYNARLKYNTQWVKDHYMLPCNDIVFPHIHFHHK